MPIRMAAGDLEERWNRASKAYARTVRTYGGGTPQAKEAWEHAHHLLNALVKMRSAEDRNGARAASSR